MGGNSGIEVEVSEWYSSCTPVTLGGLSMLMLDMRGALVTVEWNNISPR